jgi:hypothetical protein
MASTTWKPRKLICDIKPLRPPPSCVVREIGIYPLYFGLDLKENITSPTGPDLLPVLFTQNKYLHNKKWGDIPRYASQK